MLSALDPYRRIRATVALVFLVMVAALGVASLHWHRHEAVSAGSTVSAGATSASTAAQPGR